MYLSQGRIRDYNPITDTASVEIDGLGQIDAWMDAVPIDASLDRSQITHGAPATIGMADPHRLCEASVTAVAASPALPARYNAGAAQRLQTGRSYIQTGASGSGSTTVTYPHPYTTTAPVIAVYTDDGLAVTISGAGSLTGFTVTIAAGIGPSNDYLYFTWQAVGNS